MCMCMWSVRCGAGREGDTTVPSIIRRKTAGDSRRTCDRGHRARYAHVNITADCNRENDRHCCGRAVVVCFPFDSNTHNYGKTIRASYTSRLCDCIHECVHANIFCGIVRPT
jgi:hypothetical protein